MSKNKLKLALYYILVMAMIMMLPFMMTMRANAESVNYSFAVSPMKEKIVLDPGDHYSSAITIYTTAEYDTDVQYYISVAGYYVDENGNGIFEECVDRCDMTKWVKIESPTEGRLSPGEKARVIYSIDVPEDAHGGGQYASIIVNAEPWNENSNVDEQGENTENISPSIIENKRIAYTIYAEITGDVIKQGEIVDIDVPSFLLSGAISGQSLIKKHWQCAWGCGL